MAILLFFSLTVNASWIDEKSLDPNLKPTSLKDANLNEAEFNKIIQNISSVYSPIINQVGGKLKMIGEWKNEKPNAAASQMFGAWNVKISGGLARRPELTPDGFSLILCHELGHHLGGFTIAPAAGPGGGAWASNEGQSDYFATHVCAKRIWGDDLDRNSKFREFATQKIVKQCNSVYAETREQDLCYRILAAAESVANTMAVLMNKPLPDFDTPDTTVVGETSHKHPMPQCRMDTSLQGALCTQIFNDKIIPGKNAEGGGGSINAEREAASFSCMSVSGFQLGLRPSCWFKSRL